MQRAPTSEAMRRPIREAIIDASPLMNLLALHYLRMRNAEGVRLDPDRVLKGDAADKYLLGHRDNQKEFLAFFDNISILHTTSHVVGELQGLCGKFDIDDSARKRFWSISLDYLREHGFEEARIKLLKLGSHESYRDWIGIIGPPDTGLIYLTFMKKKDDTPPPLLTDDEKLHAKAHEFNVDCLLVRAHLGL